jgi:formiminotetrahydrofolate cyclodeaminase
MKLAELSSVKISESAAWDTPETAAKLKTLKAEFAKLINKDKPAAEKIRKQIQDINKESRDTADARGYKSGAPPKGWKLD